MANIAFPVSLIMTSNLHKQRQPYIPTARAIDTNEETDPGREDGNINNSFDLKRLIAILLLTLVKPICYDIVLPFISTFQPKERTASTIDALT